MKKIFKIAIAALAAAYFFWCAATAAQWHFFDNVNLLMHEAGHWIFSPFGYFMSVFGGSLNQVLMPLIFVLYFWFWQKSKYSASLLLFWVGQSLANISVYAGDAVKMQLPLLGGGNGWETGMHDWNWLLIRLGWLHFTDTVAKIILAAGWAAMIFALIGSLYFALKKDEAADWT